MQDLPLRPARRARRRAVAPLVLALGLLTACGSAAGEPAARGESSAVAFHGTEPDQVPDRPSFVLTDTDGRRFDFARDTAGRPTLLFFGFTNCPDECPTAMADISAALRATDTALREQVRVVFVTTDPARDDADRVRGWLDKFSADYVGLTGTQAEVDAAQAAVGAPLAEPTGPQPTLPGRPDEHEHAPGTAPHTHDGPLGYGVDHVSSIFAFDAADRMPVLYPPGSSRSDIAADLPVLARKETT